MIDCFFYQHETKRRFADVGENFADLWPSLVCYPISVLL